MTAAAGKKFAAHLEKLNADAQALLEEMGELEAGTELGAESEAKARETVKSLRAIAEKLQSQKEKLESRVEQLEELAGEAESAADSLEAVLEGFDDAEDIEGGGDEAGT